MKLAAGTMIVFVIIALYQIQKYSMGYHKLVLAHEMNREALVAQDLQIAFLQDELQAQRQANVDMANEVDNAIGTAETMFMVGCMDAGKSEMKCLKLKRKYRNGAQ